MISIHFSLTYAHTSAASQPACVVNVPRSFFPLSCPPPPRSRPRQRAGAIQRPYSPIGVVHLETQVDVAAPELLHEFVHSHAPSPVEGLPDPASYEIGGLEVDEIALEAQRQERVARPWWQRPSPIWYLVLSPLGVLAGAALLAPRLQLFTYLMCKDIDAGQWDPSNGGTKPDTLSMGPSRPIPCAADPVVQANVAVFLTIIETVQGILSCLTATFWGSFSDRYGRVKFLSFSIVSLLLGDAALAALAVAPEYVPGGYWFLLFTSALGGLVGGRFAGMAAVHAYLADCSDPATRSRIFSRYLGLVFIGVAFGPSLGGLVEHLSGNPYIIFYIALGLHAINAFFQWFIIPESLLPAQMDAARRARAKERKGHWFSRMFNFLSPLTVLAPLPQKGGVNPQKALEKDWSLTWLALSLAPESLVLGGMQYWLQYAAGKFNWTAEMVGYYISFLGLTRALVLVIGLPVVLHFFASRSQPQAVQLPTSPDEPLDASSSPAPTPPAHDSAHGHTPAVDLGIAKISLAVQAMVFALVAVSKGGGMFVAASALGALAAGYSPTTHSLSLELYTRRGGAPSEAGKLFGALSVIQTIGNQVVGPSLFGIVYIKTVSTFPETIFYVVVAVALLSLLFLFFVRIPPYPGTIDAEVEGATVVVEPAAAVNDE